MPNLLNLNLSSFEFVYLDMNGTFMFDHDRFGEDENYYETYVRLGGAQVSKQEVSECISGALNDLERYYSDPQFINRFPSVAHVVRRRFLNNSGENQDLISQVIAYPECGVKCPAMLNTLSRLRRVMPLVILSNIWSRPDATLSYFKEVGVLNWFMVTLFSSNGSQIKPSKNCS